MLGNKQVEFVSAEINAAKNALPMDKQMASHLDGCTPKGGAYWFGMAVVQLQTVLDPVTPDKIRVWDLSGEPATGQRTPSDEYKALIRDRWGAFAAEGLNRRQPRLVIVADKLAAECVRRYVAPSLRPQGSMVFVAMSQPGRQGHRGLTESTWHAMYQVAGSEIRQRVLAMLEHPGVGMLELVAGRGAGAFRYRSWWPQKRTGQLGRRCPRDESGASSLGV